MDSNLEQKLASYQAPDAARRLIQDARVVFVVGVTAAGKDTVLKKLVEKPDYHLIVSHTTRAPRENNGILEQNGVDYHFISLAEAENLLDSGGYVEVKMFSGNIYGTSVAEIQKAHNDNKIAIADIEVQGVAEYRKISDKVISIFLLPPDFKTWQSRLQHRYDGGELPREEFIKRMSTAKLELAEALNKDYFEFVVNRDLDQTVQIVDEVAHGHFSEKKNAEARAVAAQLLTDLEAMLANLAD